MAIITTDVLPKLFITARTGVISGVDHVGWTRPTIDVPHYTVHLGIHFFDARSAVVGDEGLYFHLIRTPPFGDSNVECHLKWDVTYTLSADIEVYEAIVGTDPTEIPLNSKRSSTTVAEARVGFATTGYTGGTLLEKRIVGTDTPAGKGTNSHQSREDEYNLKPSTTYAIKLTSNAANNRVSSYLNWYEIGSNVLGV